MKPGYKPGCDLPGGVVDYNSATVMKTEFWMFIFDGGEIYLEDQAPG